MQPRELFPRRKVPTADATDAAFRVDWRTLRQSILVLDYRIFCPFRPLGPFVLPEGHLKSR